LYDVAEKRIYANKLGRVNIALLFGSPEFELGSLFLRFIIKRCQQIGLAFLGKSDRMTNELIGRDLKDSGRCQN
jgi:hypothetical protein